MQHSFSNIAAALRSASDVYPRLSISAEVLSSHPEAGDASLVVREAFTGKAVAVLVRRNAMTSDAQHAIDCFCTDLLTKSLERHFADADIDLDGLPFDLVQLTLDVASEPLYSAVRSTVTEAVQQVFAATRAGELNQL